MADIGRGLFLLIILALLLGVGIMVWHHETDPNVLAHRAWVLEQEEQAQAKLQPVKDFANRALIYIGLLFLGGLAVVLVRFLDSRIERVYPVGGLYPAWMVKPSWFQRGSAFLLGKPMPQAYFLPAPNEARSQVGNATIRALQPGARLSAGTMNKLLTAGEVIPVEEDLLALPPPPLPDYANVYSSGIPHQLALPLGETAVGQLAIPLVDMGSIIIGGVPGKGKSECVASMIVNLLRKDPHGEHVRLAVADMKGGLDFGHIPEDLAIMEYPVARTLNNVLALTTQVWEETERRQKILFASKDAHIDTYNQRHSPAIPFLILVIDELMMMSMAATDKGASPEAKARSEKFNTLLIKIGAEGRAAGVSVIAATQKPSAEVIPTLFRDICGLGIAFWCSRNHQSIAILGEPGAEDLPNEPGVALVRMGDGQLTRIRTYHAGIKERRFLNFVERQPRSDRLRLPFDATADDDEDGNDMPDGVPPGVTGSVIDPSGGVTGETGGVIDGQFRPAGGVITPQSHLEQAQKATFATFARDLLPVTLDADSELDEQQSDLIWRAFVATCDTSSGRPVYSARGTHLALWPDIEPGGGKAKLIKRVVLAEAQRRGINVQVLPGVGYTSRGRNGRAVRINGNGG